MLQTKKNHLYIKTSVFLFYVVIMFWLLKTWGYLCAFDTIRKPLIRQYCTRVISHQINETKVIKLRVIFSHQNQFKVF